MKKILIILVLLFYTSLISQEINDFTPTTVEGGVGTVLTINGSGFGTEQGIVAFGGGSFGNVYYPSRLSEHLFWSNTEIRVLVPYSAMSNEIKVTLADDTIIFSDDILRVRYSLYQRYNPTLDMMVSPKWIYQNDGYVFMSYGLSSSMIDTVEYVLQEWGCLTGVNFSHEVSPTPVNSSTSLTMSTISVNPDAPFIAGQVGRYSSCETDSYVESQHIVMSSDNISSRYFFHEVGHAIGMSHTLESGSLMTPTASASYPTAMDIEAGIRAIELGTVVSTACGFPVMELNDCHTLSNDGYIYTNVKIKKIDCYSILGQYLFTSETLDEVKRELPIGLYITKIYYENGHIKSKKLLKF